MTLSKHIRPAPRHLVDGRDTESLAVSRPNEIITQLTENGVMEPGRLYESPFTDSAPTGPDDLFDSADVERIICILRLGQFPCF